MPSQLDRIVEESTNIPIEELRRMPLEDIRAIAEKRHGKTRPVLCFPQCLTSDQINQQLDQALGIEILR